MKINLEQISLTFSKIGFWFLVMLLCGIFIGGYGIRLYQKSQMQESVTLGGFVFEKKIYDMRLRP